MNVFLMNVFLLCLFVYTPVIAAHTNPIPKLLLLNKNLWWKRRLLREAPTQIKRKVFKEIFDMIDLFLKISSHH